jgi:hypothetical protein
MQKNEAFILPNSHKYLILVRSIGIALLAARPAPPLSMASFAFYHIVNHTIKGKAFCSRKTAPTLNSCRLFVKQQKSARKGTSLAQAEGFAPLAARPAPTLSTSSFAVNFIVIQSP